MTQRHYMSRWCAANPPEGGDTLSTIGTPIARGVGYALVGPALGGAMASPDVKAAAWSLALPVGAAIVGGVALGVVLGLWLGRGR